MQYMVAREASGRPLAYPHPGVDVLVYLHCLYGTYLQLR